MKKSCMLIIYLTVFSFCAASPVEQADTLKGNRSDSSTSAIENLTSSAQSHGMLSHELIQRLSPEQIKEILQQVEKDQNRSPFNREFDPVGFAAVVLFFLTIIAGIAISSILGFRKKRMMHETVRAMIEKGVTIPPELITGKARPRNDFRIGIILTSTGIALSLTLLSLHAPWAIGLLPFFIGLGYLTVWKFDSKSSKTE